MKTILKHLGIFLLSATAFGIGLWKYYELIDSKAAYDNAAAPTFWIFLGTTCALWLWARKGRVK
jgi:hypothetical protein